MPSKQRFYFHLYSLYLDKVRRPSELLYLELHGRVLLVLWCGVPLVVEVVGGGGMDDGRLLRGLVEALAVHVDQEGEQARPEETGNTGGDQVDGGECWGREDDTWRVIKGSVYSVTDYLITSLA